MASAAEQGCSLSQETYKFQIVEFITRGPKKGNKRSIDIVPSRWVSYDKKKSKIVAKFMEPPYNNEDIDLLYTLVETEENAPESWPTYSVKIRGHAKTYRDALKRLKMLENEDYAFTTDTDGDRQAKAKKVEKQFKTKKLVVSEETRNAMHVPSIDLDDLIVQIDNRSDSSSFDENTSAIYKRKEMRSRPEPKHRIENRSPVLKNKKIDSKMATTVISGEQSSIDLEKPSISGSASNQTCSEGNIDTGRNNNLTAQSPSVDKEHLKKSNACSNKKTHKIYNDRKSDIVMILSILKGITVDLKEIKANQQIIIQHLPLTHDVAEQNFTVKHNLSVPFKTMDDFNDFDNNLKTVDEFRTDFTSSLNLFVDRQLCLIKSCTNVFRQYLSRDVIIQFTSKRRMPGKFLINSTMFYNCILNAMTQTHKDVLTGRAITEETFLSTIGKVFNNAKDWDGQRQKRAVLQAVE